VLRPITRRPSGRKFGCPTSIIGRIVLRNVDDLFREHGTINFSYSDDRAYSWSPPKVISGSAPFCQFGVVANDCDSDQFGADGEPDDG